MSKVRTELVDCSACKEDLEGRNGTRRSAEVTHAKNYCDATDASSPEIHDDNNTSDSIHQLPSSTCLVDLLVVRVLESGGEL